MQPVLALALQSMQDDMMHLEKIGMNITNTATPGYRREVMTAHPLLRSERVVDANEFSNYLERLGSEAPERTLTRADNAATPPTITSDMQVGALQETGQMLDFALTGPGFFEVKLKSSQSDQGVAYTRQGNFHIDAQHRLVTAQGHPVIGKNGEIFLNPENPTIDATQLKVVQFAHPERIQRLGNSLFAAAEPIENHATENSVNATPLRQGWVEKSNVNPAQEMTQLLQTMRHIESMQKIVQGYDDMLGMALRKLGES